MAILSCCDCGQSYECNDIRWKCECGGILDLVYHARFNVDDIVQKDNSLWRYRSIIPLDDEQNKISFSEGMTPLLGFRIHEKNMMLKLDYLFPSGSFKDRGSTVLISKAKELGIVDVVEDSSGNAGASIATYAARAGINCKILVPASTSVAKTLQITANNATLHRIAGSREDTANAAREMAQSIYYASHVWNPWFFQGTKTIAYEICEQLNWKNPGSIIVPVGNGSLLLGAFLGFKELLESGIISSLPKIIGVQAENCSPLVYAFKNNLEEVSELPTSPTIGEGIAIAVPRRGKQILEAIRETNGLLMAVSEDETGNALRMMVKNGFYIEPTASVAIAGAIRYLYDHKEKEPVITVLTGHGLKASQKIDEIVAKNAFS